MVQDEAGTAAIGQETITVDGQHGVALVFTAERTGLGPVAIAAILIVLALGGLLVAAGIVAFLNRGRLKALFAGASGAPVPTDGPEQPGTAPEAPPGLRPSLRRPPHRPPAPRDRVVAFRHPPPIVGGVMRSTRRL